MKIEISHIDFKPKKYKGNPEVEYYAAGVNYVKEKILLYYLDQQIEPLENEYLSFTDPCNVMWQMTIESKGHNVSESKIKILIKLHKFVKLDRMPIDVSLVLKLKADLRKLATKNSKKTT